MALRKYSCSQPLTARGRILALIRDRLLKKFRPLAISEAVAANVFLGTIHWADHNARFACAPASPEDFHRRAPSRTALDAIFQLETPPAIANDWVAQDETRHF